MKNEHYYEKATKILLFTIHQYYSWLMKETILRGPENISMEMAVRSLANIFNCLDVKSINHGFKTTGLALFQSEPTQ